MAGEQSLALDKPGLKNVVRLNVRNDRKNLHREMSEVKAKVPDVPKSVNEMPMTLSLVRRVEMKRLWKHGKQSFWERKNLDRAKREDSG